MPSKHSVNISCYSCVCRYFCYNYHTYHITAVGLQICLVLGREDFGGQRLCPVHLNMHRAKLGVRYTMDAYQIVLNECVSKLDSMKSCETKSMLSVRF